MSHQVVSKTSTLLRILLQLVWRPPVASYTGLPIRARLLPFRGISECESCITLKIYFRSSAAANWNLCNCNHYLFLAASSTNLSSFLSFVDNRLNSKQNTINPIVAPTKDGLHHAPLCCRRASTENAESSPDKDVALLKVLSGGPVSRDFPFFAFN